VQVLEARSVSPTLALLQTGGATIGYAFDDGPRWSAFYVIDGVSVHDEQPTLPEILTNATSAHRRAVDFILALPLDDTLQGQIDTNYAVISLISKRVTNIESYGSLIAPRQSA
jgi:hypothetical protein